MKIAHITPLLKKIQLIEILKKYQPMSSLPVISKILETHVDGQMNIHDIRNEFTHSFQSAYIHRFTLRNLSTSH